MYIYVCVCVCWVFVDVGHGLVFMLYGRFVFGMVANEICGDGRVKIRV